MIKAKLRLSSLHWWMGLGGVAGADTPWAVGSGHSEPPEDRRSYFHFMVRWEARLKERGPQGLPSVSRKTSCGHFQSIWLLWVWAEGQDSWPRAC